MTETDRIKLAEAMGWTDVHEKSFGIFGKSPDRGSYFCVPNPFTDANDDYAVRDYFVSIGKAKELADALHHLIVLRRDPTVTNSNNYGLNIEDAVTDIQKGDYARAALKVMA